MRSPLLSNPVPFLYIVNTNKPVSFTQRNELVNLPKLNFSDSPPSNTNLHRRLSSDAIVKLPRESQHWCRMLKGGVSHWEQVKQLNFERALHMISLSPEENYNMHLLCRSQSLLGNNDTNTLENLPMQQRQLSSFADVYVMITKLSKRNLEKCLNDFIRFFQRLLYNIGPMQLIPTVYYFVFHNLSIRLLNIFTGEMPTLRRIIDEPNAYI